MVTTFPRVRIEVEADIDEAQVRLESLRKQLRQTGGAAGAATPQTNRFTGAFRALGNVSRNTRAQVQNVSFQLQDFIVQVQGGTRASVALSQQLPQLLGGFGAVGAAAGVLAGLGIPAVALAFRSLSGDADELESKLEDVRARMVELNEEARGLRLGVTQDELVLMDALVSAQNDLAEALDAQGRAQGQNRRAAAERVATARQNLRLAREELNEYRRTSAQVEVLKEGNEQILTLQGQMQIALQGVEQSYTTVNQVAEKLAGNTEAALKTLREISIQSLASRQSQQGRGNAGPGGPLVSDGAGLFEARIGRLGDLTAVQDEELTGGRSEESRARMESLIQDLQTERELTEAWREESLELLAQFNASELEQLGGQAEAKARIEQEYQERMRKLREDGARHEIAMRQRTTNMVISLLQNLGQENEGFAKAAVALNAAKAIQETIQNTAAASVRALAELGPIAGPPAAARIRAFGAAQVALIGANALLTASRVGGGGGSGGGSISSGSIAQEQQQAAPVQQRSLTLIGDRFNRQQVIDAAEFTNDATDNGLVIRGRA